MDGIKELDLFIEVLVVFKDVESVAGDVVTGVVIVFVAGVVVAGVAGVVIADEVKLVADVVAAGVVFSVVVFISVFNVLQLGSGGVTIVFGGIWVALSSPHHHSVHCLLLHIEPAKYIKKITE